MLRLIPTIAAGLVSGFLVVVSSVSYAALIGAGELEQFLPHFIAITLTAAVVTGGLVAMFSSYHGTVAMPQDRIAPILALMAAAIVETLGPDIAPEQKLLTVVASIVLATLLVGSVLLLLGSFRIGGFIRFIPYPVIGGFLAGTGWLLAEGALGMMFGAAPAELSPFADEVLLNWLPGVVMAAFLLVVMRFMRHFLILPTTLAIASAVVFGLIEATGVGLEEAMRRGWMLGPFPEDLEWRYLVLDAARLADWEVVVTNPASYGTIMLISAISLLLNSTALEVTTGRDMHLNHELRVTGAANLLTGALGGMVGMHSVSISTLAYRMGARGRVLGLTTAVLALLALVIGVDLISLLPRAVLGGLLLFLGASFLYDWVVEGYRKLSTGDYCVVLLILATVALVGFLESVAIGLLGAICLFVVNYSRVNVVKQSTNAVERQSNVDRPPRHQRVLKEEGEHVRILRLQGFLFFGTANHLFRDLRAHCEAGADHEVPALYMVVMDFDRVSAMDSSAALSFAKIAQLAERYYFSLVMCGLSPALERQLRSNVVDGDVLENVRIFPNLDHAIEWCEDQLLTNHTQVHRKGGLGTLQQQIEEVAEGVVDAERLMKYIDRIAITAQEELIPQGDEATDMYFVESGQVSVNLELESGERVRIRKMGAGTVTGELGLYLGGRRNACVVADTNAVVYRLSRTALDIMEDREPQLAAAFHKYMARLLAERLVQTNRALRGLID